MYDCFDGFGHAAVSPEALGEAIARHFRSGIGFSGRGGQKTDSAGKIFGLLQDYTENSFFIKKYLFDYFSRILKAFMRLTAGVPAAGFLLVAIVKLIGVVFVYRS